MFSVKAEAKAEIGRRVLICKNNIMAFEDFRQFSVWQKGFEMLHEIS